ncbi:hypothetical protein FVA77_17920 [Phyllobacterium endophyticum]|nr:hypothetical protein FVA77_17920 [Phyllobacterium endophyticum]
MSQHEDVDSRCAALGCPRPSQYKPGSCNVLEDWVRLCGYHRYYSSRRQPSAALYLLAVIDFALAA